jgi:predicted O-linked N-acetylglucosamine transferase (SPINDLY family)
MSQEIILFVEAGKADRAFDLLIREYKLNAELAWNEIALILMSLNRLNDAVAALQQSLKIKENPLALINLADICLKLGKDDEAIKLYKSSLHHKQDDYRVFNVLGGLYVRRKNYQRAYECFLKSLHLLPEQSDTCTILGHVLSVSKFHLEAQKYLHQALSLDPNSVKALTVYGDSLHQIGESDLAYEYYRKATSLNPVKENYNFLLYLMHHCNNCKNPDFLEVAKEFYRNCFPEQARQPIAVSYKHNQSELDPHKIKLRIGLSSKYFLDYAGERWLLELLKIRNRKDFEYYVYHDNDFEDQTTTEFKANSEAFRNTGKLGTAEFAGLIASDRIDVMVDLLGHVRGNRLEVFSLKPAPVQVSWFGYFGTTGLPQMDYVFADPQVVREGEDQYFVEKVHRISYSYCFYKPDDYRLEPAEPPVKKNGYITFGSFHRFGKVNPQVLELWAEVLKAVDNSRIFFQAEPFIDVAFQEHIKQFFVERGIDAERIYTEPSVSKEEYMKNYNKIDISLDSFPYGGGTTTLHSIWMGVPVISLEGDIWTFRGGGPLYNRIIGHEELVVQSREEYVALARKLSQDIAGLEKYRQELRAKLLASPVCDPGIYMQDLETALRSVWQESGSLKIHHTSTKI